MALIVRLGGIFSSLFLFLGTRQLPGGVKCLVQAHGCKVEGLARSLLGD